MTLVAAPVGAVVGREAFSWPRLQVVASAGGSEQGQACRVSPPAGVAVCCRQKRPRSWSQRRREITSLACFGDNFTRFAMEPVDIATYERRDKVGGATCLIHGVSGAFWEGADSERPDHFDAFNPATHRHSKSHASVLLNLIKEIEPLDVSLISKDASPESMDAMKRTVSGTLGLLPSDQFQIIIESFREPLARLLVSSMVTGYTLRNAEYRLSLQRSLDMADEVINGGNEPVEMEVCSSQKVGKIGVEQKEAQSPVDDAFDVYSGDVLRAEGVAVPERIDSVSEEVANYIQQLEAKLVAATKELSNCKQALAALEAERMSAEEQNDLLDYLRSLDSAKVAELSQPTSPDVEVVIRQVIDELLGSLFPQSPSSPPLASGGGRCISSSWEKDATGSEVIGNVPLHIQSTVTLSRDYIARLLFWCMLLGHHMRGVEYRLELSRTLSLCGDIELGVDDEGSTGDVIDE